MVMATRRRRRRRRRLRSSLTGLLRVVATISAVVGAVASPDAALPNLHFDPHCVDLSPRILTAQQQQLLCATERSGVDSELESDREGDPTLRAKCATLALETRVALPFATKHQRESVLPHVLALCTGARDLAPAACWLRFPTHQRHHQVALDAESPSPFVEVCRSAQDTAPAQCFQLWLRSSAFLLAQDALEAQPTVVQVCRSLRTHMADEFAACVKKSTRLVGAAAAFPLCQSVVPSGLDGQGAPSNRRAVVDCARALARHRLPALAIADACAGATASPQVSESLDGQREPAIRPEACMLEARRALAQWMDEPRFGTLCGRAARDATAPVECAVMLKQDAYRRIDSQSSLPLTTQAQRRRQLSDFVAQMCRGAVNASAVAACVQLLPLKALAADQTERICSAAVIALGGNTLDGNLFPAQCVARAEPILATMARQRQLQRVGEGDPSTDSAMLLLRLCERATSLAPSDCLASTQFDRRLRTELAVTLCALATSDAPQRCLRRLQQYISVSRVAIEDAVILCSGGDTVERPNRAADCAERALRELGAHIRDSSKLVAGLCVHATSAAPAECFRRAPPTYTPAEKVSLCRQANSTDPAQCASRHLPRLSTAGSNRQLRIDLCHRATSQFPAQCAREAPYGMSANEIVLLCRQAASATPVGCARSISPTLRLPPEAVARVCAQAASTLPASCLRQEAAVLRRRSEPITGGAIRRCRSARAELTSLEIASVAHSCKQLRVDCALSLTLRALDQFGGEMPALSTGYVRASAEYDAALDPEGSLRADLGSTPASGPRWPLSSSTAASHGPILVGCTVAPIANGTAELRELQFSRTGRFALSFRVLPDGPEKIAWIRIHPDVEADLLVHRCHALFLDQFQCAMDSDATDSQQFLKLPWRLALQAADCQQHWVSSAGGLAPLPAARQLLFAVPRAVYAFLIHTDVPRADMNSWERLGVAAGANRSAVRRAYHRRSLEWHPDKWRAVDLLPAWRHELDGVYALVTQAYTELLATDNE